MIIFPAIDIRGGRCVRLTEGRFDQETVFADDPSEMAARWSVAGAEYLHVVDLDGALAGTGRNLPAIKKILEHASMPVSYTHLSSVGFTSVGFGTVHVVMVAVAS